MLKTQNVRRLKLQIPVKARIRYFTEFYMYRALRVFSAGHTVAMVTYCVTKMITTWLPIAGQFFDNKRTDT